MLFVHEVVLGAIKDFLPAQAIEDDKDDSTSLEWRDVHPRIKRTGVSQSDGRED